MDLDLDLELEDSESTCCHAIGGTQTYGSGADSRSALGQVVVHWLERLTRLYCYYVDRRHYAWEPIFRPEMNDEPHPPARRLEVHEYARAMNSVL